MIGFSDPYASYTVEKWIDHYQKRVRERVVVCHLLLVYVFCDRFEIGLMFFVVLESLCQAKAELRERATEARSNSYFLLLILYQNVFIFHYCVALFIVHHFYLHKTRLMIALLRDGELKRKLIGKWSPHDRDSMNWTRIRVSKLAQLERKYDSST